MAEQGTTSSRWLLAAAVSAAIAMSGCGSKEAPPAAAPPAPADTAAAAPPAATDTAAAEDAAPTAAPLPVTDQAWSPEALEGLLAPIALFPDPVLSQVLMASTNPQEVLDAGNWLIANPTLEGKALDQGAEAAGFTPPMRAIMQFRPIVDQMCLEMGWTAELGQAFTNDQAGVLAAVQRLRQQASDVGTLQSSEQMKVETQTQEGEEVIVIEPPSPEVVYVPTYDPVAAYQPNALTATQPLPQTTTVVEEDKGHSTGSLIATGVLAFGAGLLVNEIFDDDDDDYYRGGYYYPNYGGGYMRPPPPYYYRPVYGGGYRPGYNYNRPPSYNKILSDNNVVVVNPGQNKKYWDNFDDRPTGRPRAEPLKSPITAARPNRPELAKLDADKKAKAGQRAGQVASGTAAKQDWKGQSTYAGASKEARAKAKLPPASEATRQKAAGNAAAAKSKVATTGADRGRSGDRAAAVAQKRPEAAAKASSAAKAAGSNRPQVQKTAQRDRQAAPTKTAKPARDGGGGRQTAASGQKRGGADRAASQRGKQSLPQGAKSKGAAAKKKRKG
jgi:hypothetical protein